MQIKKRYIYNKFSILSPALICGHLNVVIILVIESEHNGSFLASKSNG